MPAYYNEWDAYAAQWLRNLIAAGHLPPGDVDERSIRDVQPADLAGYTQCHFFAGIGGWSLGARLAGWPDDRPLWTGSCPCQSFSSAGRQQGLSDERHLWPEFYRLIAALNPDVVMGEQVTNAVAKGWLDGVYSDLKAIDYTVRAAVVPACAIDAPHRRDRIWFVADSVLARSHAGAHPGLYRGEEGAGSWHVDPAGLGGHVAAAPHDQHTADGTAGGRVTNPSFWANTEWITGPDGRQRRVKPGLRLMAHGVSGRVGQLRAYGNAIVPQVAAEVIGAYLDVNP